MDDAIGPSNGPAGILRGAVDRADGLAIGEVTAPHPFLGSLNLYQWLIFLGAHEARHAAQIREIAGSAGALNRPCGSFCLTIAPAHRYPASAAGVQAAHPVLCPCTGTRTLPSRMVIQPPNCGRAP